MSQLYRVVPTEKGEDYLRRYIPGHHLIRAFWMHPQVPGRVVGEGHDGYERFRMICPDHFFTKAATDLKELKFHAI